jgi:hypothetical protein
MMSEQDEREKVIRELFQLPGCFGPADAARNMLRADAERIAELEARLAETEERARKAEENSKRLWKALEDVDARVDIEEHYACGEEVAKEVYEALWPDAPRAETAENPAP